MSKVREAFTNCCKCTRDGFGGAVVSHAGCFVVPAIAGLFGGSLSHTFMAATMYITSPLIAMGATWGLDRLRGQKASVPKLMGSAAIALVVAFGINQFVGHDHDSGHDHDHRHHQHETIDEILKNQVICGPSHRP